jgi:hypothetical protein
VRAESAQHSPARRRSAVGQSPTMSRPSKHGWGLDDTGELKSKIGAVWSDLWSGGISNPLEVMEQLTRHSVGVVRGWNSRDAGRSAYVRVAPWT